MCVRVYIICGVFMLLYSECKIQAPILPMCIWLFVFFVVVVVIETHNFLLDLVPLFLEDKKKTIFQVTVKLIDLFLCMKSLS